MPNLHFGYSQEHPDVTELRHKEQPKLMSNARELLLYPNTTGGALRITYVAIKTLMDNLKKWRANFY